MQRQYFSGNSIEQAVLSAARHYKIEPERLAYTLRDKKTGFVNVRKRVVIVVDPDSPEVDASEIAEASAAASTGERLAVHETLKNKPVEKSSDGDNRSNRGSSARDRDDRKGGRRDHRGRDDRSNDRGHKGDERRGRRDEDSSTKTYRWSGRSWEGDDEHPEMAAFEEAIERVLDIMDLEIEYSLEEGDDGFGIDFSGSDSETLVRDEGRVLKAMENILPRVVRSLVDETIPCEVDCDGFQEKRRKALEDMARRTAEQVIDTDRYEILDAMNPADRRIVHLALVDHPDVETISEGRGYLKRIKIRPVRN